MITPERIAQLKALGYTVQHYTAAEVPNFGCDIYQGHAPKPSQDFQDVEPGYDEQESWAWCDAHAKLEGV